MARTLRQPRDRQWLRTAVLATLAGLASVAATDRPVSTPTVDRIAATDIGWYDQRVVQPVRTVTMEVTAYCAGPCCCGDFADGITASGYSTLTNGGLLVAADTDVLPFGSLVSVPGYAGGRVVPVLDRGGAIRGNRLDLLMPTHEAALQWGRRHVAVTIYDELPAGRLAQGER